MKLRTSFLTRFLALALALVMIVSSANLGLVARVFAASDSEITDGELVAKNYDLSAAEKALLESGLLMGQTHTYTVPESTDLISVDTDTKTVKADSYDDGHGNVWNPVSAAVYNSKNEWVEDVALTDGEGSYTFAENAFSMKVTYAMGINVDAATQLTLLDLPAHMKEGLDVLEAVKTANNDLGLLVMALQQDFMKELASATGKPVVVNGMVLGYLAFDEENKDIVNSLIAEQAANGGSMNIQVDTTAYTSAASKTQYMLGAAGKEFNEQLVKTYNELKAFSADTFFGDQNMSLVQGQDATMYFYLLSLKTTLNNWLTKVEPLIDSNWYVFGGSDLVKTGMSDAEYVTLDTLVKAVDLSNVNNVSVAKNPLSVDNVTVSSNTSMVDVALKAQLSFYEDGVENIEEKLGSAKLAEGFSEEEVAAEAAAVEDDLKNLAETLGLNLKENFDRTVEKDLTGEAPYYTIVYTPKLYTVTYDYQESEEIAYGKLITLPSHEEAGKAYDYKVNGVYAAQGTVITITGDTNITRTAGKEYTAGNLMTIIANNFGSAKEVAILTSGALNGNVAVNVRYPDADEVASLVSLENGVLKADSYNSSYAGLSWIPYSYKYDNSDELHYFGGKNSVNVNESGYDSIEVIYRLTLTNIDNAQSYLDLAETLVAEADAQTNALDSLSSGEVYSNMGTLNRQMFGALNGMISTCDFNQNNDFTDDGEMAAYFNAIVNSIINNCFDGANLRIYDMLTDYLDEQNGGLKYYYKNNKAIRNEIATLSGYLKDMLADDEKIAALSVLMTAANYGQYTDKIVDLESTMASVTAALSVPNAAIDLDSANLGKLTDALTMEGTVGSEAKEHPYLTSSPFIVAAPDKATVKINISVDDGEPQAVSVTKELGYELTDADIADLAAKADAKAKEMLGENYTYYTYSTSGSLVTGALEKNQTVTRKYAPKSYTVEIEGAASQSININNLTITLPASEEAGIRYDYKITIGGAEKTVSSGEYKFDKADLGKEIAIEVIKVDEGAENLKEFVELLNESIGREAAVMENGTLTVSITTDEFQGFAMGLVKSGYDVSFNNEPFLYMNANNETEIVLQTLINAMLKDEQSFSDATVIDMADGSGKLLNTTMQLSGVDQHSFNFVLNLDGIPAEIAPVAELLEMGYISFRGDNGNLAVELNLPEKLYQAYLTALIATGEVNLDDVKAVNNTIAVQFLWDYANGIITNDDITTETYTNTLKKLGKDVDLTQYENYYQKARTAIKEYLVVENGQANMKFVDNSGLLKRLLDKMLGENDLLKMIKEYEGGMALSATVTVKGILNNYEALILDNGKSGVTNKFDYVKKDELAGTTISGAAVVILLKDTTADLTFPATAILDLNGFALTGNVKSNGNLIIIDSDMDTFNGGSVNGDVSGNVTVIGGTYTDDVTAYLKDGYVQENGTVSNALYTIEADEAGNITYKLNSDIYRDVADGEIPSVKALAIDIAGDLLMNYFTTACLELEGQKIYGVALDDLLAILEGKGADGKIDALIEDVLNSVSAPGISNFVNAIIADVLDFENISKNIGKDPIATYKMVTAPWHVDINHVEDGDYLTVGIGYGDKSNDYTVSLEIVGDNRAINEVRELTTALAEIVTTTDVTVNIEQPTYNADSNTFDVTGTAKAVVEIDLTKNDNYTTVLAVILANGTGKTSYVEALNAGDMDALKAAVDATTITEVFTALKALSRDANFATMAKKVGAEVTADAAALEAVYHIYLTAAGAVLDRFDVTGGNRTLGSFDSDDDGIYVADKEDIVRTGDAAAKGYTVNYNLSLSELSLTVKVFGETTEEPEKPAPIVVTDTEGNKVYEGTSFLDAIAAVKEGYTVTINENVVADGGANVICSFNVVGADKLDMGTNFLTISNLDHKITSDADNLNVAANIDGYKAAYVNGAYQLVEFNVIVKHPAVADYWFVKETDAESETRYIFLDTPPRMGMTLTHLDDNMLVDFNAESLVAEIAGNDGDALVKTGDIMKVTAKVGQKTVAYITYTVIVVGDANCDGLVQSGDATKMMTIYTDDINGVEGVHSYVERLAADTWFNGQIQSGDATRIFTKYTTVMAYGDSAENQELGWNDWCEFVASEKN